MPDSTTPSNPDAILQQTEEALLQTIHTLYTIPVCLTSLTSAVGATSSGTGLDPITASLVNAHAQLQELHELSCRPALAEVGVPREVIHYIEDGRNPDVYTREFVELSLKNNQLLSGRVEAFKGFRDTLVREVGAAFPELEAELEKIVEGTGGEDGDGGTVSSNEQNGR